jgi:predicted transcriptional regulator
MKTAVSLPDLIFERAERQADRLGVTRSRLYALALEQYLDRADEQVDPVTEALNRVYADQLEPDEFGAEAARRLIDRGGWEW